MRARVDPATAAWERGLRNQDLQQGQHGQLDEDALRVRARLFSRMEMRNAREFACKFVFRLVGERNIVAEDNDISIEEWKTKVRQDDDLSNINIFDKDLCRLDSEGRHDYQQRQRRYSLNRRTDRRGKLSVLDGERLIYREQSCANDNSLGDTQLQEDSLELEFIADKIIEQEQSTSKRAFAGCLERVVQRLMDGKNGSVLVLHWEPTAVEMACQTIFNYMEVVQALEAEFDGRTTLDPGVTLSWVEVRGSQAQIHDALATAARTSSMKRPGSASSREDRPRVAEEGSNMVNVLEVRVTSMHEASQVIARMTSLKYPDSTNTYLDEINESSSSGGPGQGPVHRILTFKRGDARLQLIFCDPREPSELQNFNNVLDALETRRPSTPFHTSRVANLLRGALMDREALMVVGVLSCEASSTLDSSYEVTDPDLAIATLGLMTRIQHYCGLRDESLATPEPQVPSVEELFAASDLSSHSHWGLTGIISPVPSMASASPRSEYASEGGKVTSPSLEASSKRVLSLLEKSPSSASQEFSELSSRRSPSATSAREAAEWIKVALTRLDEDAAIIQNLHETNEFLTLEKQEIANASEQLKVELSQVVASLTSAQAEIDDLRMQVATAAATKAAREPHALFSEKGNSSSPRVISQVGTGEHRRLASSDASDDEDFALYRHVMETTVLRIQEELNKVIRERDEALEMTKRAEAKSRRDHKASTEQAKYVKEVSEKLTNLFHKSQSQQQELEALQQDHEKLLARSKRERSDLDSTRKQRQQLQSERDALVTQLNDSVGAMEEKHQREINSLKQQLTTANEQLQEALTEAKRVALLYSRSPSTVQMSNSSHPRGSFTTSESSEDSCPMDDIVALLRERKEALLKTSSSASISSSPSGSEGSESWGGVDPTLGSLANQQRPRLDRRAFTESLLAGLKAKREQRGRLSSRASAQGYPAAEDSLRINNDSKKEPAVVGDYFAGEEEKEDDKIEGIRASGHRRGSLSSAGPIIVGTSVLRNDSLTATRRHRSASDSPRDVRRRSQMNNAMSSRGRQNSTASEHPRGRQPGRIGLQQNHSKKTVPAQMNKQVAYGLKSEAHELRRKAFQQYGGKPSWKIAGN